MAKKEQALEAEKQEVEIVEGTERTRNQRAYVPRANIYETEENIVVVADMPGVDDKSVDITLEKNELTIYGYVDTQTPEGYTLAHAEYGIGDYERSFILSNEIDRENIGAVVKDGILRLYLPKAPGMKARKIQVKAG